jgi:hypothetical protein
MTTTGCELSNDGDATGCQAKNYNGTAIAAGTMMTGATAGTAKVNDNASSCTPLSGVTTTAAGP